MFVRALIVLLVVLNLGVAAWWALQPEPKPASSAVQPPGIPRLQLLRETQSPAASSPAAAQPVAANAAPDVAPASSTTTQCFSLGPFADAAALRASSTRLQPQVVRLRARSPTATAARGYNVVLPPFASRELAQAAVTRLIAAGFNDLLVMNDGPDANGIALGRYGSQEAASRHQAALQAAGFPAQLRPIGGAITAQWLDLEVREGFDIAAARATSGAAQQQVIDCASLG
ncbi:MAG: SPOR domain-containing protein [Lysobacter sp.]|nr:SPOR domain-containing protein [Lysobacter sp.]